MGYNQSETDHKRVLVTGFGPFSCNDLEFPVNPSWEVVKCMNKNKDELERELNISLITEEIPVEYKYVHENIPKLWNQHKPHLTIHLGLSDATNGFQFERQARKEEYPHPDNAKYYAPNYKNPIDGPACVKTDLEVDHIVEIFKCDLGTCLEVDISDNAGNYVCEYLYYTVLCLQEQNRSSLFVHVPFREEEEEISELARGLERLLRICVEHKRQHDKTSDT